MNDHMYNVYLVSAIFSAFSVDPGAKPLISLWCYTEGADRDHEDSQAIPLGGTVSCIDTQGYSLKNWGMLAACSCVVLVLYT